MKVGSLFAGIGGFDLGFERAGFQVAWCVEFDKHAQAVLRARFPKATIYGDIREVDETQLERVDVICGGFPCQDVSVAGKRAGLAGQRTGLFHDAIRIVRHLNPRLLILENVPGLLSSNNGLDFATVLREVGEGWDCQEVAWRVLDSQYYGVAQRRNRVFIVASAAIGHAEQVLALGESVSRNPPTRRATGQDAATDSEGSVAIGGSVTAFAQNCREEVRDLNNLAGALAANEGSHQRTLLTYTEARRAGSATDSEGSVAIGGQWWDGRDQAASLTTRCHDQFMPDKGNFSAVLVPFTTSSFGAYAEGVGTLRANGGDLGGGSETIVYRKSRRAQSSTDCETWVDDGLSNTLNSFDTGDTRTTHAVCAITARESGQGYWMQDSISGTLRAEGENRPSRPSNVICNTSMVIRRLTPVECERLQGFPDGWTNLGTTEKPSSDTHRYKQLGNAVTVNVAEWLARRIMEIK